MVRVGLSQQRRRGVVTPCSVIKQHSWQPAAAAVGHAAQTRPSRLDGGELQLSPGLELVLQPQRVAGRAARARQEPALCVQSQSCALPAGAHEEEEAAVFSSCEPAGGGCFPGAIGVGVGTASVAVRGLA